MSSPTLLTPRAYVGRGGGGVLGGGGGFGGGGEGGGCSPNGPPT